MIKAAYKKNIPTFSAGTFLKVMEIPAQGGNDMQGYQARGHLWTRI